MTDILTTRHGVAVLEFASEGDLLVRQRDIVDTIGDAWGHGATVVAMPAERVGADFFQLRTGVAGEVMQKFVNYHVRLAIVGDISQYVAESNALRDLVFESNRGDHVWFLPNLEALDSKLQQLSVPSA